MEATRQQIQRERIIQRIDALNMSVEDRQFTLDTLDEMQANEKQRRQASAAHARLARLNKKTTQEKTSRQCDSFARAALTTLEPHPPLQESEYDRQKHIGTNQNRLA